MKALTLLTCLTLIACSSPKPSKCKSDTPGIISVEDNFTGQCIEINTAIVKEVLDQGRYTYLMTVDAQGERTPYKCVESHEAVRSKMDRAYRRWDK